MTFIDLVNNVLRRLREADAGAGDLDSNPFFRSIEAHVNDAKAIVEKAYEWTHLRGTETHDTVASQAYVTIDGSADLDYIIRAVRDTTNNRYLKQVTQAKMQEYYDSTNVQEGQPAYWAWYYDATDGDRQIRVYPQPAGVYTLRFDHSKNQVPLSDAADVLKVPSLPVYLLAHAFAARERGEVAGAPVQELFVAAQTALSDAIAIDTARHEEEHIWYQEGNTAETNVRGY